MGCILRWATLVAALMIVGASASAPKQHLVEKTTSIGASFDDTWTALIDVFAERSWAIQNMEKDSGLITTDWMRIDRHDGYADCGGAGLATVVDQEIRFNVLVRDDGGASEITVNATFRELRNFDGTPIYADCASTGGVETLIQRLVGDALETRRVRHGNATREESADAGTGTVPDGTLGGRCYGNATCNAGMTCDVTDNTCIAGQP